MEGKYMKLPDGTLVWAVWHEETKEWAAVRKLTPREYMRLQGVSDEVTDRLIKAGISDTQLYRAAGDAVTVNVAYEIAKKMIAVTRENE